MSANPSDAPKVAGNRCTVCTSEPQVRAYIEEELSRNRPYRKLEAEVTEKFKVMIYARSMVNHKKQHMSIAASEWRQQIDAVKAELEAEMEYVPILLKPLYLVALKNIEVLDDNRPSADSLIKAIKALTDAQGNASDREALATYTLRKMDTRKD